MSARIQGARMCFMQMSIGLALANRVSQTILQERRCFRWADSVATASPSPRMLYNLANDSCELRNLAASEPGRATASGALERAGRHVRPASGKGATINAPRMAGAGGRGAQ